jgi:hypothetical protein
MRFEVLTASMKMTAFWDIVPCSLVEVDRRFRGAYCLHHQIALLMEAVCTSEMLVFFKEATEGYHIHITIIFFYKQLPLF